MEEATTIYHFKNNDDKRAALLTLVESGLIWKGVKSTGTDISVDKSSQSAGLIDHILLENKGEIVA